NRMWTRGHPRHARPPMLRPFGDGVALRLRVTDQPSSQHDPITVDALWKRAHAAIIQWRPRRADADRHPARLPRHLPEFLAYGAGAAAAPHVRLTIQLIALSTARPGDRASCCDAAELVCAR